MAINDINFINYVVAECVIADYGHIMTARFEECATTPGVTKKLPREVYAAAYGAFKGTWSVGSEIHTWQFEYDMLNPLIEAFSINTNGKYKMAAVIHDRATLKKGASHHRILFEVASVPENGDADE